MEEIMTTTNICLSEEILSEAVQCSKEHAQKVLLQHFYPLGLRKGKKVEFFFGQICYKPYYYFEVTTNRRLLSGKFVTRKEHILVDAMTCKAVERIGFHPEQLQAVALQEGDKVYEIKYDVEQAYKSANEMAVKIKVRRKALVTISEKGALYYKPVSLVNITDSKKTTTAVIDLSNGNFVF